ncbi:MAG: hypothetical protein AAFX09_09190 [Pseudomonadota bacterium]
MTAQNQTLFAMNPVNLLRAVLAAILAAAFMGLVLLLAALLTASALIIAGVAALGGGAYWLYRKVRSPKSGKKGPTVLVARKGAHGWTVDADPKGEG